MGSVRHRLSESRHHCNVVLVGDCRVGKSAIVNRFINNKFSEFHRATQFEKFTTSALVGSRRIKYTIWDTAGSHASSSARDLAFKEADVFLLCYKITDPSTLFSILNHWCPELRSSNPDVPAILVGCCSDLKSDKELVSALSKQGRAPISTDQALSFSQQIGAAMYVETSAKSSTRTSISAFEVAGLASMGKIVNRKRTSTFNCSYYPQHTGTIGSTGSSSNTSNSAQDSLERSENATSASVHFRQGSSASSSSVATAASDQCWDRLQPLPRSTSVPKTPTQLGASGNWNKSSSSVPSVPSLGAKTPKPSRKSLNPQPEKMVTIKCQRLTAEKNYEEIEVEVPAPIYETLQLYNDAGSLSARGKEGRRSIGAKLKNLFSKK